jgi:hypothetical protein
MKKQIVYQIDVEEDKLADPGTNNFKIDPLKDHEKDKIERKIEKFPFKFADTVKSINQDADK